MNPEHPMHEEIRNIVEKAWATQGVAEGEVEGLRVVVKYHELGRARFYIGILDMLDPNRAGQMIGRDDIQWSTVRNGAGEWLTGIAYLGRKPGPKVIEPKTGPKTVRFPQSLYDEMMAEAIPGVITFTDVLISRINRNLYYKTL